MHTITKNERDTLAAAGSVIGKILDVAVTDASPRVIPLAIYLGAGIAIRRMSDAQLAELKPFEPCLEPGCKCHETSNRIIELLRELREVPCRK